MQKPVLYEVLARLFAAEEVDTQFILMGDGNMHWATAMSQQAGVQTIHVRHEHCTVAAAMAYHLATGKVAAARRLGRESRVVLIDGDGSLLMHIQELETLKRHGLRVLICVLNDGAYGAEIHKMRADGIDDSGAIFGRPAFEAIARGFGLRGACVSDLAMLPQLFADFARQGDSEIWNFQISDQVTAPNMRKTIARGHGVM